MGSLREWEKHVESGPGRAYCGASTKMEWAFVDVDHASHAIRENTRLQPCIQCMNVIKTPKSDGV